MVVYKFSASWCSPCKSYAPNFHKVKNNYPNIEFKDIDVDENDDLVQKYAIRNIPMTLIVNESGEVLERSAGILSVEQLSALVDKHLS